MPKRSGLLCIAKPRAQSTSLRADACSCVGHTILMEARARRLAASQHGHLSGRYGLRLTALTGLIFLLRLYVQDIRFQSWHRWALAVGLTPPPVPLWQRVTRLAHVRAASVCATAGRESSPMRSCGGCKYRNKWSVCDLFFVYF